jgi:hypothetical protein
VPPYIYWGEEVEREREYEIEGHARQELRRRAKLDIQRGTEMARETPDRASVVR